MFLFVVPFPLQGGVSPVLFEKRQKGRERERERGGGGGERRVVNNLEN